MTLIEAIDTSELENGPEIIALRGDEKEGNEFRLGTREYKDHAHKRGQLFCIESGFVQVDTQEASWLLPSLRAGWIPPNTDHQIRVNDVTSGYTLFVRPDQCANLPEFPCVIALNEVLAILLKRASNWEFNMNLSPEQLAISTVILNEIRAAPKESLFIPIPKNEKLKKVTQDILENLESDLTIVELAYKYAMSESTLRRLFLNDLGINFSQWKQQAKLSKACELLANHTSVAEITDLLGYNSTSNFIAMFRKAFGYPPKQYFSKAMKNSTKQMYDSTIP